MKFIIVTDEHFHIEDYYQSSVSKVSGLLYEAMAAASSDDIEIVSPRKTQGANKFIRFINRILKFMEFQCTKIPSNTIVLFMSEAVVSVSILLKSCNNNIILHGAELVAYPELNTRSRKTFEERFSRFLVKLFSKRFKNVFFVSSWARDIWCIKFNFPKERCHIVGNPIFNSQIPIGRTKEKTVIYVGNNKPQKNVRRLCNAFLQSNLCTSGYTMRIIGKGHDDLIPEFGSSIEFIGQISDEALRKQYQKAEILCFPSLAEAFGMPALEGLAAGCNIVVSDRGALPEITRGMGFVCNPYSTASISRALEKASTTDRNQIEQIEWISDQYSPENYATRLVVKLKEANES